MIWLVALLSFLPSGFAAPQGLTGAIVGSVRDEQGGMLVGAKVTVSSPALIGGPASVTTGTTGQWRFPVLAPGTYVLDVELMGFASLHDTDIRIGAGTTIERNAVLKLAGVEASVVVEGAGSRIDARDPGFGTRFGPEDLHAIPSRRSSMFDPIRAAPGVSPTSPSSGTATTVSAFGSGTNENQFLIDGTNMTCPCNGVARAEPGVDFIQEVQIQSVGASVEYGNVQGAVINVITRQGSDRFLYDASAFGQSARLTSQPIRRPYDRSGQLQSGYERARYRDLTTNLGGPAVRQRLWFFGGYQHLRDYDSQPGTDPKFPRTYKQDKIFAKLTWRVTPRWQLVQSFHDEFWVSPEQPTFAKPFDATLRMHASVPAMTFGHLTHAAANTVWDVRVGRFVYDRLSDPSTGDPTKASHFDTVTRITTNAPPQIGGLMLIRTMGKATINHYRPRWWGADHQWKAGAQIERGESRGPNIIPTGVRYEDTNGAPSRAISSDPSLSGGLFATAALFVSDAMTVGNRMTVSAGVRFDHSRAISQDLDALDADGHRTGQVIQGLGRLYTWNLVSPRIGVTAKLTADGRTILRASYGRFSQGVLTGEFSELHPGVTPVTTALFDPATGGYTQIESVVDSKKNLLLDRAIRAPHTDEKSIGVDREMRRWLGVAAAYIRKDGANFIGWADVGGQYSEESHALAGGRTIQLFRLVNGTSARLFKLTNPAGYSMTYNGLVLAAEKRRAHGWQAFGSYTFSRVSGLQASSGATAAAPQSSSVALPNPAFGRDPNDLANARGRLPNDRPHMFRLMAAADVPRTGFVVAMNFQHFTGKPWAASTEVRLPQGLRRILIEPRGTRRLSPQSGLDVRVSRTIAVGRAAKIELLLDVLNALNDNAEEGLVTDDIGSTNFGLPSAFVDPRRAMLGIRLTLGR